MLHSIKKLTRHSLVYGIGHILSRSIGFLLLPIHTNYLKTDTFGTASLLFSSLAIFNIIYRYGFDVAFLRFFILEENKNEKNRIFSTAFFSILTTGLLFTLFLNLYPESLSKIIFRSPDFTILIRFASGILLADALSEIPFLVLRGEEKSTSFCVIKLINVIANFVLNVVFIIYLKKGIEGIFLANLIASCITLISLLPIIIRLIRINFNVKVLKEFLCFGLPYVPSLLSVLIMDQISRFFIDRIIDKTATGIFSASYKLGMFMALIVAAFRFAWHPFFLSTSKDKNAKQIFSRILTYFLAVTGFFFLIISFFIKEIVNFKIFGFSIFGSEYLPGITIVPIIMLAYIAFGIYVNLIVGVYLKKKTKYLPLITGIGAVVAVIGNYFLIPVLGIRGAAFSTLIAYSSMTILLYLLNNRLYPINYEYLRIFKLFICYGILFFLGLNVVNDIFIFKLILIFSIIPLLWVAGFFTRDEKAYFFEIFTKNTK